MTKAVRDHFDSVADDYDAWKSRSHHYYSAVKRCVREVIPSRSSVCEVGCGTGDVLAGLQATPGYGLDISPVMIERARAKHPHLEFAVHDIMSGPLDRRFRYVFAADVAEHVDDLNAAFRSMAEMLEPEGALVVITANPKWSGILHLAERMKLKMPEGDHRWRSRQDLAEAARSTGLGETSFARFLLIPKAVPLVERFDGLPQMRPVIDRYGIIQRGIYSRDPNG